MKYLRKFWAHSFWLFVGGMVFIRGPSLLVFIQVSAEATEDEVSPDDEHVNPNRISPKYQHWCTSP